MAYLDPECFAHWIPNNFIIFIGGYLADIIIVANVGVRQTHKEPARPAFNNLPKKFNG